MESERSKKILFSQTNVLLLGSAASLQPLKLPFQALTDRLIVTSGCHIMVVRKSPITPPPHSWSTW